MTFTQKTQMAYGVAALVTTGAYAVWLLAQLQHTAAPDIDYVPAMRWALLASLIIHSLGRSMAYGTRPKDRFSDARDRDVNRHGDALTFYVFSALAAVPFILGIAGQDAFWVTNTLFLAFTIAAVFSVAAKLVIYGKGV